MGLREKDQMSNATMDSYSPSTHYITHLKLSSPSTFLFPVISFTQSPPNMSLHTYKYTHTVVSVHNYLN